MRCLMRALITGAAGFLGSAVVDRLLADGHQVVGIDNLGTGSLARFQSALRVGATGSRLFTLIRRDVQAPELTDIIAGANPAVTFHLAAQADPEASRADAHSDARSNVLGTINLCEAARRAGVAKIIYPIDRRRRSCSANTVDKAASEMYLHAYAQRYGLRPIGVAMPHVDAMLLDDAVEALVAAGYASAASGPLPDRREAG